MVPFKTTSLQVSESAVIGTTLSAASTIYAQDLNINSVQFRAKSIFPNLPNVFIGDSTTGNSNIIGHTNIIFGPNAGANALSGCHNNFFGAGAGRNFNGTNGRGCHNNFFGCFAGIFNSEGSRNNFLGSEAGRQNTTGSNNNFLGNSAGYSNTTGSFNNFIGRYAGTGNTAGSNNTIIGNNANVSTSTLSGVIVLGTGAIATQSHQIVLSTANVLFRSTGNTFEIGSPSLTDNLTVYGAVSSTDIVYAQGGNSSQWNSTFTTVQNNSGSWGTGGGGVDTDVRALTGNWQNTFTVVQANSASWEESADILPTVTNYLSTNNVLLSSATISNTLSISSVQVRARGTSNIFIGDSTTGNLTATGNHNFVFGLNAGNALTSGCNNVFVGRCAGRLNSSGCNNNFLGWDAGGCNTGSNNNFFGDNAGFRNTGSHNNFFGALAGSCNTTGSDNNFIGRRAGFVNTTGSCNNFIGYGAGYQVTTGCSNSFFGSNAGRFGGFGVCLVGSRNSVFGACAASPSVLFTTVSACNNSFFGFKAGAIITDGNNNNFFGYNAGCSNTTGNCNNFIGDFVGRNNSTGSFNNFFGNQAGCCNTTGNSNLFLGNCAGGFNRVGSDNIFIGNNANTTSSNVSALNGIIAIGTGAIATQTNQIVLSTADISLRTLKGSAAGPNLFIGDSTTGNNNATGNHNFVFGLSAGNALTTGSCNVFIGSYAGRLNSSGTNNNFLGFRAGFNNTTGGNNNFLGRYAGRSNTTGVNNNFFGPSAGFNNTTGSNNNFLGAYVGRYNTTGVYNNFLGFSAGRLNTTGCYNNFLGDSAGLFNTTGGCNNFLGRAAGCTNTIGSNNTIIGNAANVATNSLSGVIVLGTGAIATQTNQIVLSTADISIRSLSGIAAGPNLFIGNSTTGRDAATGNHNFVFGLSAGNSLTTGSYNVFIGRGAGRLNSSGCNNNFLGRNAGGCNTGSNNNFFGDSAGLRNTGYSNNFFGTIAGFCNTTGNFNNFFGSQAGRHNTTGSNNSFFGSYAGRFGPTFVCFVGSRNSIFGADAAKVPGLLGATVSACNNSFFGFRAGFNITNGNNNNFFGYNAGYSQSTGNCNNFIGDFVGRNNTTGNSNNFFGNQAGCCNTTGNSNLFLGNCAGGFNRTGSDNIFIGNNANTTSLNVSALNGIIAIGTGAIATESHQVVLSTANVLFRSTGNTFEIGSPSLTDNLTVFGTISSTQAIFASGGNSNQWNSSFTTTQANTATDSFDLSYVGTLPVPLIPIYTTTPLRDALLGASGSQAATYRDGKWITGLSITGYNNPTIDNLISLSSTNIVGIRDSFSLSNLTKLTNLSFPSLASIGGGFTGSSGGTMNSLTTMSFPSLASIGGSFTGNSGNSNMNSLTTMSFPSLASIGGNFTGNSGGVMNSLTTMSFPSLASIGGAFTGNSSGTMNSLTTMSFPSLASIGGSFTGNVGTMNSLTTMSFPSLASIGGAFTGNVGTMNSLTTMSFPSLASIGGNFIGNGSVMNSLTTMSFPSLASIGGVFTGNGSVGFMNSLTTLLIGSGLKHINGDFSSGNIGLDRHNAWVANTYYPSATSFTAPASAFSSTTTGTTCSAAITNHDLQTGDIITVSGITGTTAATHNFNAVVVPVTRIDANNFSYTITATTQIPTGTATIQRQEVTVTPITKNGRKYICTGAGTSSGTEPTWPTTIGQTVTDGTVTWTCSEMSLPNILSRLDALSGTNQTTTYGANRFISIVPITLPTVNSISTTAGVATITTATNHGITTGTQVVISGCTGTALRYNGVWTVTSTGLTTLTTPVPTDLNGVAGAGTMRLTNACPQYTGSTPISATTITGVSADSHMIFSTTQLRDADNGTGLPIFVAGIYNRNGTTNGFARYSCTENGWDIWYDTTTKRWVNSPSNFAGNTTVVGDYPHTAQSVPLASTSSANPAVITSSVNHGVATGAVFTVVIEGCSNTALNGSWTATSTGTTTFTIPVNGSAGATTNSGTVAVLNQTFNQGRLMSGTVASPIQGVLQTITTTSNHGFSNGDFIHFYGAVGTHAASIIDSNTSSTTKSVTTAITVTNATTFTLVRYANSQPFIGSYTLTTMPHMRDPSVNDVAYHTALKLRARGLAVSLHGANGI